MHADRRPRRRDTSTRRSTSTASRGACRCSCATGRVLRGAVARRGAHLPRQCPREARPRRAAQDRRRPRRAGSGPSGSARCSIPLDDAMSALVPYRATGGFRYVSATDVIRGTLAGRRAARTRSSSSAPRPRASSTCARRPCRRTLPGVEVHATLVSGILDGTIKNRPPEVLGHLGAHASCVVGIPLAVAAAAAVGRVVHARSWASSSCSSSPPTSSRGRRRTGSCSIAVAADDAGAALLPQHGLRLLLGSALAAPHHRALRHLRAEGAGGRDVEEPRRVLDAAARAAR